jgi:hypothetical protein
VEEKHTPPTTMIVPISMKTIIVGSVGTITDADSAAERKEPYQIINAMIVIAENRILSNGSDLGLVVRITIAHHAG